MSTRLAICSTSARVPALPARTPRRPLAFRRASTVAMCDAAAKKQIADSIRGIPDFPHKGILFWDVTTLMLDPAAFQASIDAFVERYKDQKIDAVAGARLSHRSGPTCPCKFAPL